MKSIFLPFILMLSLTAEAQKWEEGNYMIQALAGVLANAQVSDYGYTDGICFMGAWIDESNSCSWTMNLQANTSYQFLGGGDNDAVDLDIIITDSKDNVVKKDNSADNSPAITFTPTVTGKYTIKLELFACASLGSFCAIATMQKNANTLPIDNIKIVIQKLREVGEYLLEEKDVNLHFMKEKAQWCVYGAVIDNNRSSSIDYVRMGYGEHFIVSTGDKNLADVDLYIKTMSDGKTVCSDEDSETLAAVKCLTEANKNYTLKIQNSKSDGKSLIITSIFDLD